MRLKSDSAQKQRGFTLVEVIVAMALMAVVIASGFMLLSFGSNAYQKGVNEYDTQAAMRLSMEKANTYVRNAAAVFTIPQSTFDAKILSNNWDYFGTRKVVVVPADGTNPAIFGSEIVNYVYNPATNLHDEIVIMEAAANRFLQFIFTAVTDEDESTWTSDTRLLHLEVQAYSPDHVNEYGQIIYETVMDTMLEAANSLQIVDYGTAINPAAAIAYRNDARPDVVEARPVYGNVALVMDTSGSMEWALDGTKDDVDSEDKRITYLKDAASDLVREFAKRDNVDIVLVPFANSANGIGSFLNAKSDLNTLLTGISNLNANGGTNTGDGIRRAYHALINKPPQEADATITNNIILLVDGESTYYTVTTDGGSTFLLTDGAATYIRGNGSSYSDNCGYYIRDLGVNIKASSTMRVFLVGLSEGINETRLSDIATWCGVQSTDVFHATSYEELLSSFAEITQTINDDLWYLMGPRLN